MHLNAGEMLRTTDLCWKCQIQHQQQICVKSGPRRPTPPQKVMVPRGPNHPWLDNIWIVVVMLASWMFMDDDQKTPGTVTGNHSTHMMLKPMRDNIWGLDNISSASELPRDGEFLWHQCRSDTYSQTLLERCQSSAPLRPLPTDASLKTDHLH